VNAGMKFAIFICLAFLTAVGFYLFDFQPKWQEMESLEKGPGGIAELTAQRDADKAYVENIEEYERQLKEAQAELAKLEVDVDEKDFIPSYLEDIEKLVKEVRVSLKDWDFEIQTISTGQATPAASGEGSGGSAYNTYLMSMTFDGQLGTLQTFLTNLSNKERFKKLVVVNGITMSPKKSKDGSYELLTFSLPLMAYQFTKGGAQ